MLSSGEGGAAGSVNQLQDALSGLDFKEGSRAKGIIVREKACPGF